MYACTLNTTQQARRELGKVKPECSDFAGCFTDQLKFAKQNNKFCAYNEHYSFKLAPGADSKFRKIHVKKQSYNKKYSVMLQQYFVIVLTTVTDDETGYHWQAFVKTREALPSVLCFQLIQNSFTEGS